MINSRWRAIVWPCVFRIGRPRRIHAVSRTVAHARTVHATTDTTAKMSAQPPSYQMHFAQTQSKGPEPDSYASAPSASVLKRNKCMTAINWVLILLSMLGSCFATLMLVDLHGNPDKEDIVFTFLLSIVGMPIWLQSIGFFLLSTRKFYYMCSKYLSGLSVAVTMCYAWMLFSLFCSAFKFSDAVMFLLLCYTVLYSFSTVWFYLSIFAFFKRPSLARKILPLYEDVPVHAAPQV